MTFLETPISVKAVKHFDLDLILRAWKYSRPKENDPSIVDISESDIPVHEFTQANFEITVPVLLREWIVSFRDHSIWARGTRVDDLNFWPLYDEVDPRAMRDLFAKFKAEQDAHQDTFRRHIPLGYMTGLSMVLSFRSWIKLILAAKEMAHDEGLAIVVRNMFADFATRLAASFPLPKTDAAKGAYYNALRVFKPSWRPVRYLSPIAAPSLQLAGDFYIVSLPAIPMMLRAQLVRHRAISFVDNLYDLMRDPDILNKTAEHPIMIQFSCTADFAEHMVTKRNCWIAQEDLWSPILSLFNGQAAGGKPWLPCDKGRCPAQRDNELRKQGRDPSPPCPVYARLYCEPFTSEQASAANDYLKLRPLTRDFWEKEIHNA